MASHKSKKELSPQQLLRIFTVVGGFLLLAGLFVLWMGFGEWQETRSFVVRSVPAKGRVVELELRDGIDHSLRRGNKSAYYPIFIFKDASGTQHRVRSQTGSNPSSYHIGEEVPVLYPPKSPREARIDSFGDLWFMASLFGGIGVTQFVVGGFVVARGLKRLRAKHESFA